MSAASRDLTAILSNLAQADRDDDRPAEGWGLTYAGRPTFVRHSASILERPPALEGFVPSFVGRHGTWTRWTYRAKQWHDEPGATDNVYGDDEPASDSREAGAL